MTGANNRINLTRISHVKFWALATARAGYANRCAPKAARTGGTFRLAGEY